MQDFLLDFQLHERLETILWSFSKANETWYESSPILIKLDFVQEENVV